MDYPQQWAFSAPNYADWQNEQALMLQASSAQKPIEQARFAGMEFDQPVADSQFIRAAREAIGVSTTRLADCVQMADVIIRIGALRTAHTRSSRRMPAPDFRRT